MRIELEDGEILTIATNHGVIVINAEPETGTLITAAASEGHRLKPKMIQDETGKPLANVWLEPVPSQNSETTDKMFLDGKYIGEVANSSMYPKDGSRFELNIAAPVGFLFFPAAYWDEEAGYFTAELPKRWIYPYEATLHPKPIQNL